MSKTVKHTWKRQMYTGRYERHMIFLAAAAAKLLQSCLTLCDPIDGSPPGSPIPGILQARTLEWVAISFSDTWKWKVKGKALSPVRLLATPWTTAHQVPPSMGFSRKEYWNGLPFSWLGELTYHNDIIYSQINNCNANSYTYNLLFCFSFFKLELGKIIIKFIWKKKKYEYPVKSRERRAREKGSSKSLLKRKIYLLDRPMEPNRKSRNRPKCLKKFSLQ